MLLGWATRRHGPLLRTMGLLITALQEVGLGQSWAPFS